MITYKKYTLPNGLRLFVQRDPTTTVAAVNVLYDAGARDEDPGKTGFAHLFEHLMFGGSVNVPDFDGPLQYAGGENNAFTSNDLTNYYISIPQNNLDTALWLESDRMFKLAFSEKSLEVQRQVVVEEFRQRYLNQPYGDLWLLLRPLAYKVHPYRWATIGMDISHIENAVMTDVRDFYQKYYHPGNAILSVVSGLEEDLVAEKVEKWFGEIAQGPENKRALPQEPVQIEARELIAERDVPFDIVTLAFHMCGRLDNQYYAEDLVSDILSSGRSSRMFENLIRKNRAFTEVSAYITGDADPGLFIVYGKLSKGTHREDAYQMIMEQLNLISRQNPEPKELEKAINRIASVKAFGDISGLNRAYKMAWAEWIGDLNLINHETEYYQKLKPEDIREAAAGLFKEENCNTLYYISQEKK